MLMAHNITLIRLTLAVLQALHAPVVSMVIKMALEAQTTLEHSTILLALTLVTEFKVFIQAI